MTPRTPYEYAPTLSGGRAQAHSTGGDRHCRWMSILAVDNSGALTWDGVR